MMGMWWRMMMMMMMMMMTVKGQEDSEEICHLQKTCGACIQIPGCLWCTQPNSTQGNDGGSRERVYHCKPNTTDPTFCDPENVQDPSNQVFILQDKPFTEIPKARNMDSEKIVQMRPQRMNLKLRKGVPQTINVTYSLAADYPVDLYYLMDLSRSMKDDKESLATLGETLADLLNNLTTQYRLGFGSYVDKVLIPYVDTSPEKLENPCLEIQRTCAKPYSFKNALPLNPDHTTFTRNVKEAETSRGIDAPEGGFDALMQVMLCHEQIGWRDTARKIIVFSTDESFHFAGDGRLAGITTPNDMKCHLTNDSNEYHDFDKYDYPSVAQINEVATRESVNIIWAISGPYYKGIYTKLSNAVKGSSYGQLANDSSNVITLVEEQYKKLSSVVELSDNSSEGVDIVYRSKCLGNELQNTSRCEKVRPGNKPEFSLQITANQCPANGEKVYVEVRTTQDSLVLEIDVLCSCDCDNEILNKPKSINCSGAGTEVCGVCQCDEGFSGEKCECSNVHDSNREADQARCRNPDSNSTELCSGQGGCSCGRCVCYDSPQIHGRYCQCNRLKCKTSDNEECHGRGYCDCSKCMCHEGYTGDLCQCRDEQACIRPGSKKVCSGRGTCDCGVCKCKTHEGTVYDGRYCEDCSDCGRGRCTEFRDCVQCLQFKEGPMNAECHACNITVNPIDSLQGQIASGSKDCAFNSDDGCRFSFTYRYNPEATDNTKEPYLIYVRREKECPPPPPVQAIAFGLIGAIVAIGVITLVIWKIVTTIHDNKEFAKFEEETRRANWSTEENPLYREANTTVHNPAYNRRSVM